MAELLKHALNKTIWNADSYHEGITLCFTEMFNYEGLYHGKQSLHHYILALSMQDHTKRNFIFLPHCIYGIVILTQIFA